MSKRITQAQVLRRARALIVKGWVKRSWARDEKGIEVSPASRRARCFCASAAVDRSTPPRAHFSSVEIVQGLERIITKTLRSPVHSLIAYNDAKHRRKSCILHLFDLGIAAAEEGRL